MELETQIWIGISQKEGFWQKVENEKLPQYCTHCRLQEHENLSCRHGPLQGQAFKDKQKVEMRKTRNFENSVKQKIWRQTRPYTVLPNTAATKIFEIGETSNHAHTSQELSDNANQLEEGGDTNQVIHVDIDVPCTRTEHISKDVDRE